MKSRDEINFTSDDRTKEIQIYLTKHLNLTPRRLLFEEQEKASAQLRNQEELNIPKDECKIFESPANDFDLNTIKELREFRQNNIRECMSQQNRQRLQRSTEKEENYLLSNFNYRSGRMFPLVPKDCEKTSQAVKKLAIEVPPTRCKATREAPFNPAHVQPQLSISRLKNLRFTPENSLALAHQKFKYWATREHLQPSINRPRGDRTICSA